MYDTTYRIRRVVGDLVMWELKTESRDTMIALDNFGGLTGYSLVLIV